MLFNRDAVQRIRAAVKAKEGSPSGVPKELQPHGFPAPRAFLVGKADEAIAATTDPLTAGSINSGTVSIYRWNETDEAWEDTGDDVEAHDFSGSGCASGEWVQLHRLGFAGGVLWILGAASPGYWHGHITSDVTSTANPLAFAEVESSTARCFTNSSGTLTCTRPGGYHVSFYAYATRTAMANGSNTDALYLELYKNGSTYEDATAAWLDSAVWADVNVNVYRISSMSLGWSVFVPLAVGDTLKVVATISGSRTTTIVASAGAFQPNGTALSIVRA